MDPRQSFGKVAANYSVAAYHTDAERLQELVALAAPQTHELALDVATGTGNVALAMAPHCRGVVGVDLTMEMLQEATRVAGQRGAPNLSWVQADAAGLPFRAATFDLYTVRSAPHHFRDVEGALAEAVRVLKPKGRVCLVDCAPPADVAPFLHQLEVKRDPSHVRSRPLEEWAAMLEEVGLEVETARLLELDWDFDGWMNNMAVPEPLRSQLTDYVEQAPEPVRSRLKPHRVDGRLRHAYWHALIRARKR